MPVDAVETDAPDISILEASSAAAGTASSGAGPTGSSPVADRNSVSATAREVDDSPAVSENQDVAVEAFDSTDTTNATRTALEQSPGDPATNSGATTITATAAAAPSEGVPAQGPTLVESLLALVGRSFGATGDPAIPIETPGVWVALAAARRELGTLRSSGQKVGTAAAGTPTTSETMDAIAAAAAANSAPAVFVVAGFPNTSTGVVTGSVIARDKDRDPLTYGAEATSAKGGSVVIDAQGKFTYTPTAAIRHAAAATTATAVDKADTFTVAVDDGHGHTVTQTVTVRVGPTNAKPTNAAVTDLFTNPNSGKVTGTIVATDADHDDFTLTGPTSTKKGAITYDSATDSFTYIPTQAARQAASAPRASALAKTDSFRVTLSDGHGGTTAVTVKVDIAPLPGINTPPTIINVAVGEPDSMGTVTGIVTATDPDRDDLTYSATGATAKGSVVVNSDGTFTYTPTQAARLVAFTTAGDDTDSFTVTVSDGLATTSTTVAAPILPAKLSLSTPVTGVDGPVQVVFSPDGGRAYVTIAHENRVSVMDTTTNTEVESIDVGYGPQGMALNTDGTRLYVANSRGGISVVDTAGNSVVDSIEVPDGSTNIAISPDGTRGYVTNYDANTVSVLDLTNDTVVTTLDGFHRPLDVAVSRDGSRVYVTNVANGPGEIQVIDAASYVVTDTIHVGSPTSGFQPLGLALSPDGALLYTADISHDNLTVIRTSDNAVIDFINGPSEPTALSLSPDGSLAYVTSQGDDKVSVIDLATKATITSFTFADHPLGITVSPDGTQIYVNRTNAGAVSVLSLVPATSNDAPTASPTVTNPDFVTGAVTVVLNATDPDGDPLSYTVSSGPARGTVTPTGDGTFTYTPNGAARTQAEGTAGPDSDTFTVSVSDGQGATTVVPVTVTIAPALIVNHTLTLAGQYQYDVVSPDKSRITVSTFDTDPVSGAATTRVAVIDTATGTQIGDTIVIAGGDRYAYPLVTPGGDRAVFTTTAAGDGQSTLITVVDITTGQQIGSTITVAGAAGITKALNADGSRVVVTGETRTGTPSTSVSIIDTTTGTQIGTSVLVGGTVSDVTSNLGNDVGEARTGLAVTPDGQRVVVTTNDDTDYSATTPVTSRLIVVDAATGAQIGTTITLRGTAATQLTGDGSRALASAQHAYNQNGTILNAASQFAVVDTATGVVLGRIVDINGYAVPRLTDDGSRLVLVTGESQGSLKVTVLDAATGGQIGATVIDGYYETAAVYGNRVVVTAGPGFGDAKSISVFDTVTGTQVGTTIQTAGTTYIYGLRQVDDQNRLLDVRYSFNGAGGTTGKTYVSAIDLTTGTLLNQTVIDGQLYGSKVSGDRAIVATKSAEPTDPSAITRVAVFDTGSGVQLGATLVTPGARAYAYSPPITLSPDGQRAWIVTDLAANSTSSVAVVALSGGAQIGTTTTVPGVDVEFDYANRVFSPDGTRMVLVTDDNGSKVVSVFDTSAGALVGAPAGVGGDYFSQATFRADGARVIVSVYSVNDAGDVETTDTVIDTTTGAAIGQPVTFPGADVYSLDGIPPGTNAIEFGYFYSDREMTSVTLVDTDTGVALGDTVTFAGSPTFSQYRAGDTFGTVFGITVDYSSDTTTFNITHVQTGSASNGGVGAANAADLV
ncbi:Ig-like domain-containing protein [Mycolicibacterium chubuense]|uniref:Ig-like domain-containing protein n=1 Tax=Mycolicibacterium chubuense TaxID=1800 RepID=UPI00138AD467|nr:Ig-like domain-containing protein [Mycolicibacterium chubuense]